RRRVRLHELLGPLPLHDRIRIGSLGLQQGAARLLDRRLEGRRVDLEQLVAVLYRIALLEQDGVEIPGDASADVHPVDRLDAAGELDRFGDGLLGGDDCPYRDGLLGERGNSKARRNRDGKDGTAHAFPPSGARAETLVVSRALGRQSSTTAPAIASAPPWPD